MTGAGVPVLTAQGGSELRDAACGDRGSAAVGAFLTPPPLAPVPSGPRGAPRGAGAGPAPARPRSAPPRPGTARHSPLRSDQVSARHGTAWHGSVPAGSARTGRRSPVLARDRRGEGGRGQPEPGWGLPGRGEGGGGGLVPGPRGAGRGPQRRPAELEGSPSGSPSPGRDVAGGCPQDSSPCQRVGGLGRGLGVAGPPGSTQRVAVGTLSSPATALPALPLVFPQVRC